MVTSHPRLFRVAFGVVRDRHLAEDATQQAFLAIWRDIRRLRDPSRFEAWSNRLLVRICYAEAKQQHDWLPDHESQALDALRAPDQYGAVIDRDQLERGFRSQVRARKPMMRGRPDSRQRRFSSNVTESQNG